MLVKSNWSGFYRAKRFDDDQVHGLVLVS